MPGRPDLSVIVVTHQGRDLALHVLRTTRAATGPIEVEWLVVDSGSSDGTPDAIERELPEVTVMRRPNIGFAAGNNVALRAARGRYLLLLNPDLEIVEGTLAQLVAQLPIVVDLAVEDDDDGAVLVVDRLVARLEVDHREALDPERDVAVSVEPAGVGPAVLERRAHPRRKPRIHGVPVGPELSDDSAHSTEQRSGARVSRATEGRRDPARSLCECRDVRI